jgi:hypothetical protein
LPWFDDFAEQNLLKNGQSRESRFLAYGRAYTMSTKTNDTRPPDSAEANPTAGTMESIIQNHPFSQGMSPHQYRILADVPSIHTSMPTN